MRIKSLTRGRSKTLKLALILFLSLTLLTSLIGLVKSYEYPDKVVEEVVGVVITQKIDLNYLVLVKSSIIYDNRTVLQPGETIYTRFLEGLNVTYRLKLSSSKDLRNIGGSYEVSINISSPIWFKEVALSRGDVRELIGKAKSLYVNFTYLRDYIDRIEKEVGNSRAYTISVVFRAHTNVEVMNTSASYTLTSTSKLELRYDSGKPFIEVIVSAPESKHVDSVKQTKIMDVNMLLVSVDMVTYRVLVVLTSVTSAAGLALTLIVVTRDKAGKKIPTLLPESKYTDLMISGELEQIRHVAVVVRVQSFVDLVKVATMRRKPIIRLGSSETTKTRFAVVEGDVIYLYEETMKDRRETDSNHHDIP